MRPLISSQKGKLKNTIPRTADYSNSSIFVKAFLTCLLFESKYLIFQQQQEHDKIIFEEFAGI